MPLKTTNEMISSMVSFFKNAADNLLLNNNPFPRWKAPSELDSGTFESNSEGRYRQEISKKKSEQDAEKLINRGNDYYFSLAVKKAHRMFNRSRIEAVSIEKSLEKGFSDESNGFLNTKYKLLGDKVDPNDV